MTHAITIIGLFMLALFLLFLFRLSVSLAAAALFFAGRIFTQIQEESDRNRKSRWDT